MFNTLIKKLPFMNNFRDRIFVDKIIIPNIELSNNQKSLLPNYISFEYRSIKSSGLHFSLIRKITTNSILVATSGKRYESQLNEIFYLPKIELKFSNHNKIIKRGDKISVRNKNNLINFGNIIDEELRKIYKISIDKKRKKYNNIFGSIKIWEKDEYITFELLKDYTINDDNILLPEIPFVINSKFSDNLDLDIIIETKYSKENYDFVFNKKEFYDGFEIGWPEYHIAESWKIIKGRESNPVPPLSIVNNGNSIFKAGDNIELDLYGNNEAQWYYDSELLTNDNKYFSSIKINNDKPTNCQFVIKENIPDNKNITIKGLEIGRIDNDTSQVKLGIKNNNLNYSNIDSSRGYVINTSSNPYLKFIFNQDTQYAFDHEDDIIDIIIFNTEKHLFSTNRILNNNYDYVDVHIPLKSGANFERTEIINNDLVSKDELFDNFSPINRIDNILKISNKITTIDTILNKAIGLDLQKQYNLKKIKYLLDVQNKTGINPYFWIDDNTVRVLLTEDIKSNTKLFSLRLKNNFDIDTSNFYNLKYKFNNSKDIEFVNLVEYQNQKYYYNNLINKENEYSKLNFNIEDNFGVYGGSDNIPYKLPKINIINKNSNSNFEKFTVKLGGNFVKYFKISPQNSFINNNSQDIEFTFNSNEDLSQLPDIFTILDYKFIESNDKQSLKVPIEIVYENNSDKQRNFTLKNEIIIGNPKIIIEPDTLVCINPNFKTPSFKIDDSKSKILGYKNQRLTLHIHPSDVVLSNHYYDEEFFTWDIANIHQNNFSIDKNDETILYIDLSKEKSEDGVYIIPTLPIISKFVDAYQIHLNSEDVLIDISFNKCEGGQYQIYNKKLLHLTRPQQLQFSTNFVHQIGNQGSIYLPPFIVKESWNYHTLLNGDKIVIMLPDSRAFPFIWHKNQVDDFNYKIHKRNKKEIEIELLDNLELSQKLIISQLRLKKTKYEGTILSDSSNILIYLDKKNKSEWVENPIPFGISNCEKYDCNTSSSKLEVTYKLDNNLNDEFLFNIQDDIRYGGKEKFNYLPKLIIKEDSTSNLLHRRDILKIVSPKLKNGKHSFQFVNKKEENDIYYFYTNGDTTYLEFKRDLFPKEAIQLPIIKFNYPIVLPDDKEMLALQYIITNEYKKNDLNNFHQIDGRITFSPGQPIIRFNNHKDFIVNYNTLSFEIPDIIIEETEEIATLFDKRLYTNFQDSTLTFTLNNTFPAEWDTTVKKIKSNNFFEENILYEGLRQFKLKITKEFSKEDKVVLSGLKITNFNSQVYDPNEVFRKPVISIKRPNSKSKKGGSKDFIFSHNFADSTLYSYYNDGFKINIGKLRLEWAGIKSDKIKINSQNDKTPRELPVVSLIFENIYSIDFLPDTMLLELVKNKNKKGYSDGLTYMWHDESLNNSVLGDFKASLSYSRKNSILGSELDKNVAVLPLTLNVSKNQFKTLIELSIDNLKFYPKFQSKAGDQLSLNLYFNNYPNKLIDEISDIDEDERDFTDIFYDESECPEYEKEVFEIGKTITVKLEEEYEFDGKYINLNQDACVENFETDSTVFAIRDMNTNDIVGSGKPNNDFCDEITYVIEDSLYEGREYYLDGIKIDFIYDDSDFEDLFNEYRNNDIGVSVNFGRKKVYPSQRYVLNNTIISQISKEKIEINEINKMGILEEIGLQKNSFDDLIVNFKIYENPCRVRERENKNQYGPNYAKTLIAVHDCIYDGVAYDKYEEDVKNIKQKVAEEEKNKGYDFRTGDVYYLWVKSLLFFIDSKSVQMNRYWERFLNRSDWMDFAKLEIQKNLNGIKNYSQKLKEFKNKLISHAQSNKEMSKNDAIETLFIFRSEDQEINKIFKKYLDIDDGRKLDYDILISKMKFHLKMQDILNPYFKSVKNVEVSKNINGWIKNLRTGKNQLFYTISNPSDSVRMHPIITKGFTKLIKKNKVQKDKIVSIMENYFSTYNEIKEVSINLESAPDSLTKSDRSYNNAIGIQYRNNNNRSLSLFSLNDNNYSEFVQLFPQYSLDGNKKHKNSDNMDYYLYGGGKYLFIPNTEKNINEYSKTALFGKGLKYIFTPVTISILISLFAMAI